MLPAWLVRCVCEDPRKIPYLLVWKSRKDHEIKEAVRLARFVSQTNCSETGSVEIKRTDGSAVRVFLEWRPRSSGGTDLLLRCTSCARARRALYGAKAGDDGRFHLVHLADWECRTCAKLRYSSEGGASIIRTRCAMLQPLAGQLPRSRPEPWLPLVFSSPAEAAAAGICKLNGGC
jgi:hypothetical protein